MSVSPEDRSFVGEELERRISTATMRGIDPSEVIGLVLAGGRSSRMGRDKAFLEIGGESLIQRQLRILREVGIREVFLSLRKDLVPLYLSAGTGTLPDRSSTEVAGSHSQSAPSVDPLLLVDEEEGLGPMAGVVGAMARVPERHLLVLAVDMPQVKPSLLRALLVGADPGHGVAPKIGGMWEPLCALYPPRSYPHALHHLHQEGRSPSALLSELASLGRMRALSLSKKATASLRSWNTPEDIV